jgi:hypothetical protein
MEKLYQLWYLDLKARRRFQIWTILIAFTYGVFNSFALGRPEKRVTWETLGMVFFLTATFSAYYCLRSRTSPGTSKVKFTYAHVGEVFRQNRRIFELGLASLVALLALFLASRLPNSRVQAAGIDMRLNRALFSPNPFDPNAINEITTLFQTATTERVSINPRLLRVAGMKVEEASRENPSAWPAALAFLRYRSSLSNATSSNEQGGCFRSPETGLTAGVADLTIVNCPAQELDHLWWRNVVFENVTVIYHGGPTLLQNVQFKHCQFNLDYGPGSLELAKALAASNTVTVKLPGN